MQRRLGSAGQPDIASFNATVGAWARAGDVDRAEKWLAKMLELSVKPKHHHVLRAHLRMRAHGHGGAR